MPEPIAFSGDRGNAMTNQTPSRRAARSADPPAERKIELKLRGEPEVLKAMFARPAIRARATGRGSSRRLENVYYDTADQRLRARRPRVPGAQGRPPATSRR